MQFLESSSIFRGTTRLAAAAAMLFIGASFGLAWMLHEQPIVIEFSAESSMVGDGCRRLKG